MKYRIGSVLFSAALVLVQCGYRPSEAAKTSMLVVYATGDVFVTPADQTEKPVTVGMVVRARDTIRTEQGSIDLQSSRGAAIRVREFTTLAVSEIQSKGPLLLSLKRGTILSNVPKSSKAESFEIKTPTAVAGVRGTTFSVSIDEESRSQVRVLDGSVSFAPRIPVLEGKTAEQIEADPLLKKLARIQAQEAVLQKSMQGRLDANLEKKIIQAADTKPAEDLESARAVETETVEIPVREVIESRTLVTVNPELIDKAIRGEAQAPKEIADQQEAARERVLDQILTEVKEIEMKSEDEIRKRYARLEIITLNTGEKVRGAVIAQTDTSLLVHTTSGVRKIPRGQLVYQEPL